MSPRAFSGVGVGTDLHVVSAADGEAVDGGICGAAEVVEAPVATAGPVLQGVAVDG